jgi:hypothetical protein
MQNHGMHTRDNLHVPFAQLPFEAKALFHIESLTVKAFGGLKESTAHKLREIAEESGNGASQATGTSRQKIGTQYVREYDGKLHQVTVLDSGYDYKGATYHSLTEIARVITGTKRSGPAFFDQLRASKEAA